VTAAAALMHTGPLTVIRQSNGHGGVYTVGREGLGRLVTRCRGCLELQDIAWSPDGTRLAMGTTSYGLPDAMDGLHVINLVTGRDRQLTSSWGFANPAWSPDGAWLAYDGNVSGRISLIRADGSRDAAVITGLPGVPTSPTWSPDGTRIAFQSGHAVYVIRLDGTHRRLLARQASSPAWSPRGIAIAYKVNCGIRLITPTGTNLTPYSPAACQHVGVPGRPVWSPDGRKIAIVNTGAHPGTYVMNANGNHLTRLTFATGETAAGAARPAWQPRP
jgi:Tol biopolymer transport system component